MATHERAFGPERIDGDLAGGHRIIPAMATMIGTVEQAAASSTRSKIVGISMVSLCSQGRLCESRIEN
jgi:hypothetical protein